MAADPVDGRAGARPERHGRRPAHRAASPAQRALQPDPQLPGAGRQAGADPGSHAHQHRRLRGVQVPEVHGPLRHEGLLAAPPRLPVLSRDGRAHLQSAAARAREEPAALQGQGLRRARAPDVLRGPRGLQHARPDGPHSAAAAGAPDRRGFFLLRRRRALRLRATRGAEAEAHAPRAGQRQVPRSPRHAGRPSQAGRPLPLLETPNSARQHDPAGGAGAQGATQCRECLASFETVEKKLHHCHGTGQYLGALCHSCNIAAQTPKTIPVVFHNGGGYDFHFLLRYIATMGSPVSRAPREELGEDSDNEGSESEAEGSKPERPMPMAKAAPKAKAKARLPHEPGQHDRRPQGLHAQAAAGALPADGLASPRAAAAHADGLSASKTASQAAADALRAGAGVGLHPAQAAHALRALLRRRGVGDARGVGAVSAEDHRLAVNTANVMGWETFREFHDCYLHTDVLALADVMESYRDSFRAQSGLDPIHYVTLPGAAWDAMLRHSARKTHHRRAGLQGRAGLRHGRAELHLPALRSSQQPRAGRGGLQP